MGIQYVGTGRLGTKQTVSYTGTAGTIASPIGTETYKVRVLCTTDAYVLNVDGPAFAAVTSSTGAYLPALMPEYFTVSPGQKISAIQVSAGGTLEVVEMS
jgi:hypothetical protein